MDLTLGSAQAALQLRIDAQQLLDSIEYGLRSIRACGGERYCTGIHAGQLAAAKAAAASIGCAELRDAKAEAAGLLKAAKADLKAIGGVRQLRLALEAHDYELTA
jgi:hypothetical protein